MARFELYKDEFSKAYIGFRTSYMDLEDAKAECARLNSVLDQASHFHVYDTCILHRAEKAEAELKQLRDAYSAECARLRCALEHCSAWVTRFSNDPHLLSFINHALEQEVEK